MASMGKMWKTILRVLQERVLWEILLMFPNYLPAELPKGLTSISLYRSGTDAIVHLPVYKHNMQR